jgi:drug/metabolite transporter (DMT)-like permease
MFDCPDGTAVMVPSRRFSATTGVLLLVLSTALWGSSFVVIKFILPDVPASAVNLGRFTIGAIALLPFVRLDRRMWRYGLELSVWLFLGFATQTIGLKYTSANRAAFITALNVIFVPMLAAIFGHRVRAIVWAAAVVALAGCGLLCGEGGGPNVGDWWSLGTAITWACYIFRLESVSTKFPPLSLAVTQLVPIALMCGIWTAAGNEHVVHFHWAGLIYLGLGATVATTVLQTLGQQVVPAPQAAVIFTLEPVFAVAFSFMFLGDRLAMRGFIGAGLIILAAITSQVPGMLREPERERVAAT